MKIKLILFLLIGIQLVSAQTYVIEGVICPDEVIYFPFYEEDYIMEDTPENTSSKYSMFFYSGDEVLEEYKFNTFESIYYEDCIDFDFFKVVDTNTDRLAIEFEGELISELILDDEIIISNIQLNDFGNYYNLSWNSNANSHDIYLLKEDSQSKLIASNIKGDHYIINKNSFSNCIDCKLKLIARSFFDKGEVVVEGFNILNEDVLLNINYPLNNYYFYQEEIIFLRGSSYDFRGIGFNEENLRWYLNNDFLEEGKSFEVYNLDLGIHNIRLTGEESGVSLIEDEIKINIINNSLQKYTIELNEGWNLISVPLFLMNDSFEYVFSDIYEDIEIAYSFDKDGAKTLIPGLEKFSDLEYISPYHGYYIKMNNSRELEVEGYLMTERNIHLNEGWNLISYLGDDTIDVLDVFSGINGIEIVEGFDEGAKAYIPSIPFRFSTLTELNKGFGYWVKINEGFPSQVLRF